MIIERIIIGIGCLIMLILAVSVLILTAFSIDHSPTNSTFTAIFFALAYLFYRDFERLEK